MALDLEPLATSRRADEVFDRLRNLGRNRLSQKDVDMRGITGDVAGVHVGEQLINHPKDGSHGKHTGRDADHHQGGPPFAAPNVMPYFDPDYTHFSC